MLLHGNRLQARLLAAGGEWASAQARFAQTLAQAAHLDLPLEVARTQAAWAEASLLDAPSSPTGGALLAQAELEAVKHLLRR